MRPQTGSLADAGWCWRSKALQDFGKSGYPVGHIYDIGGSRNPDLLKHNVCKAFTPDISGRQRSFPSELFFHGEGSAKWSQITEMLEFYQMRNEIELLEHHGGDIAKEIAPGSIVIDMGYGCDLNSFVLHCVFRTDFWLETIERYFHCCSISSNFIYQSSITLSTSPLTLSKPIWKHWFPRRCENSTLSDVSVYGVLFVMASTLSIPSNPQRSANLKQHYGA